MTSPRVRGVFYNNMFGNPTALPVTGNTIHAVADDTTSDFAGASLWTGVYIISQQQATGGATFSDNSIDAAGSSYGLTPATRCSIRTRRPAA